MEEKKYKVIKYRTPLSPMIGVYNTLEVCVCYIKGGPSWCNGPIYNPRSVNVVLKPILVKDGMMSCRKCDKDPLERGFKVLAKEVPRYNRKVVEEIAERIRPIVDDLGRLYSERKITAAARMVKNALA